MYGEIIKQKVNKRIMELENTPKIDFNAYLLPERTADTMSDVIALSSPDGKISKGAHKRASGSIGKRLFGNYTPDIRHSDEVAEELKELYYARTLIGLVNRGSGKRKYPKVINPILERYIKQ